MSEADCIFCAIARGEAERSVVYEDSNVIAFMDILPVTPGHLLVAPKRHATYLADLEPDTGSAMMQAAMACAAALRHSPLRTEGINLFLADGEAAGQEVLHVHLHVLPRFAGDGFGLRIDYDAPPARSTLDYQADVIARNLEGATS